MDIQFSRSVIIIVGIAGFSIGCMAAAVVALVYCYRKQRRLERCIRRHRSHSAPAESTDPVPRPAGINALPGSASPLNSESFPPWTCAGRSPGFLDRQHSFHGTTTTSLGRQCSNSSSVRAPGKVDNFSRWLPHMMNSSALAYTTVPRHLSNLRLPSTSTTAAVEASSSSRAPVWADMTLPPRLHSRHLEVTADDEAAALVVMPRRASEQDSVFLPAGQPPNETHQLLSSGFQPGE